MGEVIDFNEYRKKKGLPVIEAPTVACTPEMRSGLPPYYFPSYPTLFFWPYGTPSGKTPK